MSPARYNSASTLIAPVSPDGIVNSNPRLQSVSRRKQLRWGWAGGGKKTKGSAAKRVNLKGGESSSPTNFSTTARLHTTHRRVLANDFEVFGFATSAQRKHDLRERDVEPEDHKRSRENDDKIHQEILQDRVRLNLLDVEEEQPGEESKVYGQETDFLQGVDFVASEWTAEELHAHRDYNDDRAHQNLKVRVRSVVLQEHSKHNCQGFSEHGPDFPPVESFRKAAVEETKSELHASLKQTMAPRRQYYKHNQWK